VEVLESKAGSLYYSATNPEGFRLFPQPLVPVREALYRRFPVSEPIAKSQESTRRDSTTHSSCYLSISGEADQLASVSLWPSADMPTSWPLRHPSA
jgi:hypothetical protein